MVLGNTKAKDLPETKGRFLYNVGADTFEFQAFFFNDTIKKGDYQKGEMLIEAIQKKKEINWEEDTVVSGPRARHMEEEDDDDWPETDGHWSELGEEDEEETYEGF